jgi:hypothetical protein
MLNCVFSHSQNNNSIIQFWFSIFFFKFFFNLFYLFFIESPKQYNFNKNNKTSTRSYRNTYGIPYPSENLDLSKIEICYLIFKKKYKIIETKVTD